MNPKAVAAIVIVALVVLAALVALAMWWLSRQAGVRRAEYRQMQRDRNAALLAVQQIDMKADQWRDVDSVLASEIRTIVRELNNNRMELSQ